MTELAEEHQTDHLREEVSDFTCTTVLFCLFDTVFKQSMMGAARVSSVAVSEAAGGFSSALRPGQDTYISSRA